MYLFARKHIQGEAGYEIQLTNRFLVVQSLLSIRLATLFMKISPIKGSRANTVSSSSPHNEITLVLSKHLTEAL